MLFRGHPPRAGDCRNGFLQPAATLLGFGAAARRKQDDEFVASAPDARIVRPGRLLQHPGDLLQRTIAGEVPILVVDDLEVVEIQQNEREL